MGGFCYDKVMKQVPYQSNPGNACALTCYTMVAQYLLPDRNITFEQLAKIADWKKGYVVWGFPVWEWLMNQGIYLTDYDNIDYEAWAKDGVTGLKSSIPAREFAYYQENSFDLEAESERIKLAFNHPHFTYVQHTPSWDEVVTEFNKPGICDVTLNLSFLNREKGFVGHRVILIDISKDVVVFHDPNGEGTGAYRHEPLEHFKEAVASFGSPELARYSLQA